MTKTTIALASVVDWAGFSHAVRGLRAEGVAPEDVRWCVAGTTRGDLFDTEPAREAQALPSAPALRLPKAFVDPAREVFLHASDAAWPLLHRLAIRIADDALAWSDPLHPDRLQFDRFHREVRREIHKMHAFVRFRRIEAVGESGQSGDRKPVRHVAWIEPAHPVVEAAAPFFARRFSTMRWAILTPRVSVEWNGEALAFGPGAGQADAPGPDAGEALWLAYYRSIFNPARVKVAMMKKEMPVRFWKNLPEASAIGSLLVEAPRRQHRMIADGGAERDRRRGHIDPGIALGRGDANALSSPDVDRASVHAVGQVDEAFRLDSSPATGTPMASGAPAASMQARSPAPDLALLRRQAARCRDCPVADVATQTVFGEGDATARLMIVGEQPGDHEDLRGRPFQGPAGQLLQGAFETLGWDARLLYLTNAVKHFHHELRGKRRLHKTPGQREADACLHWLEAEIAAVRPAGVVALGATAARSLLGEDVGVLANEGRWFERRDGLPVLICLHPAAILRADVSRQSALQARWIASLGQATPLLEPDDVAA